MIRKKPKLPQEKKMHEENSTEEEINQNGESSHEEESLPLPQKTTTSSSRKQFRCTTCNYVTNVKARYTKHVKYHSMPSIKCDYCDFKTPYKWNLDRHYKNHNGDGSLSCPLCNFTCDIKQSLTVHIQNHHTVLPPNIADLIKQSLGYTDAPITSVHFSDSEEFSSNFPPVKVNVMKRRNSSPVRTIGNTTVVTIRNSTGANSSRPKRFKTTQTSQKVMMSPKRLNCQYCNFKTVSEMDMKRHILTSHSFRNILPSPTVSRVVSPVSPPKQMPSLIPIKPQNMRNPSQKKSIHSNSNPLYENNDNVEYEDTFDPRAKEEGKRTENTSDSFEEKSAFLEYFALKPNNKTNNSENIKKELASAEESQNSLNCSVKVSSGKMLAHPSSFKGATNSIPRRRTSFFEKLTQKLVANSKTEVAEDILHQDNQNQNSITISSNSTRCQYCRHRCKSSVDLISHLGQCPVAKSYLEEAQGDEEEESNEKMSDNDYNSVDPNDDDDGRKRIFVWNNTLSNPGMELEDKKPILLSEQDDLIGYETEPGIGSIQLEEGHGFEPTRNDSSVTTSRSVYKCPQQNCGFWATTASRFHVHVVGHYNLKPFECSHCSYRSNWRWDITKHIKLKTLRDPSHSKAKVLLTHESGERNYRKYDRYLVSMDVKYSADSKLPDCSTVASKRSDVECSSPQSGVSPPMMISPSGLTKQQDKNCPKLQMPKLTKAPSNYSGSGGFYESNNSERVTSGVRMGLPPTLKPISISVTSSSPPGSSRTFVEKRMLAGCEIKITPHTSPKETFRQNSILRHSGASDKQPQFSYQVQHETGNRPRKSQLWKCKRCPFKHPVKDVVLIHLRNNHKDNKESPVSNSNQNSDTFNPVDRLKRKIPNYTGKNVQPDSKDELLKCQQCHFITTQSQALEEHTMESHASRGSSTFPCAYCSSILSSRKEFLQHMKMHGTDINLSPEDQSALTITPEETHTKPRGTIGGSKKYHCLECPYVTDSKGQFLYHKQFHISRESLFKCPKCSYNVSHKHLLHQHIRVHGSGLEHMLQDHEISGGEEIIAATAMVANYESEEEDNNNNTNGNHPTVLVWKNDKPYRMFRCHSCPQVFKKLQDLQDHEEEHNQDVSVSILPHSEAINLSLSNQKPSAPTKSSSLLKVNYNNPSGRNLSGNSGFVAAKSVLYFCDECPARFFFEKELRIHHTFHITSSAFRCQLCSYSARQQAPHLMSHMRVHGREYQTKTQQLLIKFPKASLDFQSELQLFTPSISITPATTTNKTDWKSELNANIQGSKPDASINCKKCPAKFNTMTSFVQHMNNHGRLTTYKCRYCDYGTDTGNNLTLHEILHAGSEITIEPEPSSIINRKKYFVQNKTSPLNETIDKDHGSSTVHSENLFEADIYQGNPEFIYPTYVKNGRVKIKRYKCIKCPSAFEKRDQYRVHIGLHGSDQRYKCTVCDYAVTYYANYIQHLKKHENQANVDPELLIVKPFSKIRNETANAAKTEVIEVPEGAEKMIDELPKRLITCPSCPFSSTNQSHFQEHLSHHIKFNPENKNNAAVHKCIFCDFVTPKKNMLRDHVRLHCNTKNGSSKPQAQSHMFIEDVQIFLKGKDDLLTEENYDDEQNIHEGQNDDISIKSNGVTVTLVNQSQC